MLGCCADCLVLVDSATGVLNVLGLSPGLPVSVIRVVVGRGLVHVHGPHGAGGQERSPAARAKSGLVVASL